MDAFPRRVWSTADVDTGDASLFWCDVVCEALVGVSARPRATASFRGSLEHVAYDGIGFSSVASCAQQVVRTGRMIARDHEESVLVNIQVEGRAEIRQQGRTALLTAGSLAFVDSSRPYELSFPDAFSQLVVKVPRALLPDRALHDAAAVEVGGAGPGRLVGDFLVGLYRQRDLAPGAAAALMPHALGLLGAALSWAAAEGPAAGSSAALHRERIHRFVTRHAHEPGLDADVVAAGCGLSRRTLFRVLSMHGETLTTLVREARVTRARQLLRSAPERPLAAVARACGFGGEAQLHRAFRRTTGTTPGAYRAGASTAPRRHRDAGTLAVPGAAAGWGSGEGPVSGSA